MLDADRAPRSAVLGPVVDAGRGAAASERDSGDEDHDVGGAEVRRARCAIREWTPDGLLRHPAFLRLRDDKRAARVRAAGVARRRRPKAQTLDGTVTTAAGASRESREPIRARAEPAPPKRRAQKTIDLLQPQEDLLAGGEVHEGRPDRVLPRDLAVDAAVPREPAAGADALPRRHRRQVVLSEGRAGVRAGVDSHGPDLERGHPARHQLLRLRRRGVAALHRQPRLDPAAHLGEPRRVARAARLVRDRSRSEGGAVLRRDPNARRCCTGSARRSGCRTT